MGAEHWIHNWQKTFAPLAVHVAVADVGQSSVFLDIAERKVVLAPSLEVYKADKILASVYDWWKRNREETLVACIFT